MSVPFPVRRGRLARDVGRDGTSELDERALERRGRLDMLEMRVHEGTHRVDEAKEVDAPRLIGGLRHAKRLLRLREVRRAEEVVPQGRRADGEDAMVDVTTDHVLQATTLGRGGVAPGARL